MRVSTAPAGHGGGGRGAGNAWIRPDPRGLRRGAARSRRFTGTRARLPLAARWARCLGLGVWAQGWLIGCSAGARGPGAGACRPARARSARSADSAGARGAVPAAGPSRRSAFAAASRPAAAGPAPRDGASRSNGRGAAPAAARVADNAAKTPRRGGCTPGGPASGCRCRRSALQSHPRPMSQKWPILTSITLETLASLGG